MASTFDDYSSEDDEVDIACMTDRHKRKLEALLARPVEWDSDAERDNEDTDHQHGGEESSSDVEDTATDHLGGRRRSNARSSAGAGTTSTAINEDDDEADVIAKRIDLLNPNKRPKDDGNRNISFLIEAQQLGVDPLHERRSSTALPSMADVIRSRKGNADETYTAINKAVKKDQSFSLRELKKLRKLFEEFDDHGGMNFRVFVEKVGPIIKHKASGATLMDMEVLFKRIDANANGSVDWFEISDFLLMNDVKTSAKASGGSRVPDQFERKPISKQQPTDHPATRFLYHTEPATRMLINHRYGHYYTSSTDGSAKMWDPDTLRHERTFHFSKSPIIDMVQTSWGDAIGILSMDGTASFYTPDTGDLVRVYRAERKREIGVEAGTRGVLDDRRGYIHRPVFTVPISPQELEEIRYASEEGKSSTFGRIDACSPHLSHFIQDRKIETVGLENLGWLPRSALSRSAMSIVNTPDSRGMSSVVRYDATLPTDGGSVGSNASTLVPAGYIASMATFTDSRTNVPTRLLFGLESGHIQLYDLSASSSFGAPIAIPNRLTLAAHSSVVSSIKVCETMNLIFTASHDGTLQVRHWDRIEDFGVQLGEGALQTASPSSTLAQGEDISPSNAFLDISQRGHTRRITAMDWCLRSRVLASCGIERDALLWSPYLPKPITRLEGEPMSHMLDIRFCESSNQVMTLSSNRTVKIWDLRTYRCLHTLRDYSSFSQLSPSSSRRGKEGSLNVASSSSVSLSKKSVSGSTSLPSKKHDGLHVAAFDTRKSAVVLATTFPRQWLIVKNNKYTSRYVGHRLPVVGMVLSAQFGQLITADERSVIVWDAVFQSVIVRWRVKEGIAGITLDTNGRRLFVATLRGTVLVYNYVNAQLLRQCHPMHPNVPDAETLGRNAAIKEASQRKTVYERCWVQETKSSRRGARRRQRALLGSDAQKNPEAEAAAALAPESEHDAKGHEWEVDVNEQLILHDDGSTTTSSSGSDDENGADSEGTDANQKSGTSKKGQRKLGGKSLRKQEPRFVSFGEFLVPHKQYMLVTGFEEGRAVAHNDNDTAVSYPNITLHLKEKLGDGPYCAAFVDPSMLIFGGDGVLVYHSVDDALVKTDAMLLLSQKGGQGFPSASEAGDRAGTQAPKGATQSITTGTDTVGEGSTVQHALGETESRSTLGRAHATTATTTTTTTVSRGKLSIVGASHVIDKKNSTGEVEFSTSPPSPVECLVALFEGPLTEDPMASIRDYLRNERDQSIAVAKMIGTAVNMPSTNTNGAVNQNDALEAQLRRGHTPTIDCVAVMTSIAPYIIVTGSSDGLVQLWSGRSLTEIFRFRAVLVPGDAVRSLLLSVDGRYLAVGDSSGYISVFDFTQLVKANSALIWPNANASSVSLAAEGERASRPNGATSVSRLGQSKLRSRGGQDGGSLTYVSPETIQAFAFVGQVRQVKSSSAMVAIEAKSADRARRAQSPLSSPTLDVGVESNSTGGGGWASVSDVFVEASLITLMRRFRAHEGPVVSLVRLDTNAQSTDRNVLRRDNPEAFVQERDGDYIASEADGGHLRYIYSCGEDTFVHLWDVVDVQGISCVGDAEAKIAPLGDTDRAGALLDAIRRQCIAAFILLFEEAATRRLKEAVAKEIAKERKTHAEQRARPAGSEQLTCVIEVIENKEGNKLNVEDTKKAVLSPAPPTSLLPPSFSGKRNSAALGADLVLASPQHTGGARPTKLWQRRQEEAERRKQDEADKIRYNAAVVRGTSEETVLSFIFFCCGYGIEGREEEGLIEEGDHPSDAKYIYSFCPADVPEWLVSLTRKVFTRDSSPALQTEASSAALRGSIEASAERVLSEMMASVPVSQFLSVTGLSDISKERSISEGDTTLSLFSQTLPPELIKVTTVHNLSSLTDGNPLPVAPLKTTDAKQTHNTRTKEAVVGNKKKEGDGSTANETFYLAVNPAFTAFMSSLIGHHLVERMVFGNEFAESGRHRDRPPPFVSALLAASGNGGGSAFFESHPPQSPPSVQSSHRSSDARGFGTTNSRNPSIRRSAGDRSDREGLASAHQSTVSVQQESEEGNWLGHGIKPLLDRSPSTPSREAAHEAVKKEGQRPNINTNNTSGYDVNISLSYNNNSNHSNKLGGNNDADNDEDAVAQLHLGERLVVRPPRFVTRSRSIGGASIRTGVGERVASMVVGPGASEEDIRNAWIENSSAFDVTVVESIPTTGTEAGKITDATCDVANHRGLVLRLSPRHRHEVGDGSPTDNNTNDLGTSSPKPLPHVGIRGGADESSLSVETKSKSNSGSGAAIAIEAMAKGTLIAASLILRYGSAAMKARYLPMLVGSKHEGPRRVGTLCCTDAGSLEPLYPQSTTLQEARGMDSREGSSGSTGEGASNNKLQQSSWVLKGTKVCLAASEEIHLEHVHVSESPTPILPVSMSLTASAGDAKKGKEGQQATASLRHGLTSRPSDPRGGDQSGSSAVVEALQNEDEGSALNSVIGTIFVVLAKGPLKYKSNAVARYHPKQHQGAPATEETAGDADEDNDGAGKDPNFPLTLVVVDSVESSRFLKFSGRSFSSHGVMLTHVTFADLPITRPSMQILGNFEDGRMLAVEVFNFLRMGVGFEPLSVANVLNELARSAAEVAERQRRRRDESAAAETQHIRANRDETGAELPLMARLLASNMGILTKAKQRTSSRHRAREDTHHRSNGETKASNNTSDNILYGGVGDDESLATDALGHEGLREDDVKLLRRLGIAPSFVTADEAEIIGGGGESTDAMLTPREKDERRLLVRDVLRFVGPEDERDEKKTSRSRSTSPRIEQGKRITASTSSSARGAVRLLPHAPPTSQALDASMPNSARLPERRQDGTKTSSSSIVGGPSTPRFGRRAEGGTGGTHNTASFSATFSAPNSPRRRGDGGVSSRVSPSCAGGSYVSSESTKGDVFGLQASLRDMRQLSNRLRQERFEKDRCAARAQPSSAFVTEGKGQRGVSKSTEIAESEKTPPALTFLSLLPPPYPSVDNTIHKDSDREEVDGIGGKSKQPSLLPLFTAPQRNDPSTAISDAPDPILTSEAPTISPEQREKGTPRAHTKDASPDSGIGRSKPTPCSVVDLLSEKADAIRSSVLSARHDRLLSTLTNGPPRSASVSLVGSGAGMRHASITLGQSLTFGGSSSTAIRASVNPAHRDKKRRYDDIVSVVDELSGRGSLWDSSARALAAVEGTRGVVYHHGEEYMAGRIREALSSAEGVGVGLGTPASPLNSDSILVRGNRTVPLLVVEGGGSGEIDADDASGAITRAGGREFAHRDSSGNGNLALTAPSNAGNNKTKPFNSVTVQGARDAEEESRFGHGGSSKEEKDEEDNEMLRNADDYFEKVLGIRLLQREMEVEGFVTDKAKRALIGLPPYKLTESESERYHRGFLMSDVSDRRTFWPTPLLPKSRAIEGLSQPVGSSASDALLQRLSDRRRRVNGGGSFGEGPSPPLLSSADTSSDGTNPKTDDSDPNWLVRVHSHLPLGTTLTMPQRPPVFRDDIDTQGANYPYSSKETVMARESAWIKLLTNPKSVYGNSNNAQNQPQYQKGLRTSSTAKRNFDEADGGARARVPRPPPV